MGNLVSNMMPAKGGKRPALSEGDESVIGSIPERGTTGGAARNRQGRSNARGGGGVSGGGAMAVASAVNSSASATAASVEQQTSEINFESNSSSMSDGMLKYDGQAKHNQHFSLDNVQFTENHRPAQTMHRTAPPTPRAKSPHPDFQGRAHSPLRHLRPNCCNHAHANRQRFYDANKMSFAQLKAMRTKQRLEFQRNTDRNRMMHLCHNHNHPQQQQQQQQTAQQQKPQQSQLPRSASKYLISQDQPVDAEAAPKTAAQPAAAQQSVPKSTTSRKQPASAAASNKTNKKSNTIKQTEFKPTKPTTRSAAKMKAKKVLEACQEDAKDIVRTPAKKVKNCVSPRKSPRQIKKQSGGVIKPTAAAKQKASKAATPRGTQEEVAAKPDATANKNMENILHTHSNPQQLEPIQTQQQQQQQQQQQLKQKHQKLQQQQYHPQLYMPPSYTDFSQYQAQLLRREHESDELQHILNKTDASSDETDDSFESSSSSSVPMSELLLRLDCKSRKKKSKSRTAKKNAARAAEQAAAVKAAEEAYKAQYEIEKQEQMKQQEIMNKESAVISGDSSSTTISLTEILSKIEGGSNERGGDIDERQTATAVGQIVKTENKKNEQINRMPKSSVANTSVKSSSIATASELFGDDEIIERGDDLRSCSFDD